MPGLWGGSCSSWRKGEVQPASRKKNSMQCCFWCYKLMKLQSPRFGNSLQLMDFEILILETPVSFATLPWEWKFLSLASLSKFGHFWIQNWIPQCKLWRRHVSVEGKLGQYSSGSDTGRLWRSLNHNQSSIFDLFHRSDDGCQCKFNGNIGVLIPSTSTDVQCRMLWAQCSSAVLLLYVCPKSEWVMLRPYLFDGTLREQIAYPARALCWFW